MFRIECESKFKRHYAGSANLSDEIKRDLEFRGAKVFIEEPFDDVPHSTWDPGGMLLMNDKNFIFDLGDITIKCKSQHYGEFAALVSSCMQSDPRGYKVKYYKLHGYWTCICLTTEQLYKLSDLIKDNPERSVEAQKSRMKRLSAMSEAGVVVKSNVDGVGGYISPLNLLADEHVLN